MIGLPGPTLRDEDVRLFRDTRAAGLILYRRNFESPAQLAALLGGLESALGRRLLVSTDHEGGRIVMLGRGVTIFPDNLAVRSEEHTSELQSHSDLVCRLLLEKKKKKNKKKT